MIAPLPYFNPYAYLLESSTSTANNYPNPSNNVFGQITTNSPNQQGNITNNPSSPLTQNTSTQQGSNLSGAALVNSAKQFYQAAVKDGYTYNNIDPVRDRKKAKGMDCCTGPWNFLANYLTKEDFAKLEPHQPQAYVWDSVKDWETRVKGFSGAIEKAGLGKSFKVDTAYVNSLKGKTSEQINQELTGKFFTYSGTNDKTGEGEGHVAIISKAWKDEKGNIKFEILGPHNFNKKVQEGNSSGIGTSKRVEDLSDFLKPNKTLTLATINDDVIQRAEKANDPQNRSGAGSSIGAIVYKEMTKQIANA
ncbi:MAG: hypothetical protein VKK32_04390 [Candidatus Melainabacteria bacterium]|nr:hypothetical protein [Candidatus Melainabacteria bacterium]